MGQRLVINGIKNHTPIFNIYYHWSAYTETALHETDQLLKYLLRPENCGDLVLSAIEYCENSGGGITGDKDFEEAKRLYPDHNFKTDGISRNDGLIAITAEGMDNNVSWAEETIDIDFDNDLINNNVFWGYDDIDQINEEYEYDDDEKLKDSDILVPHISVEQFHFDQIDEVDNILVNNRWFQGDCCILSKIE